MEASVYEPVSNMLRRIGWDIETAKEAKLIGKILDTKWVIYARRHNRIAVTFDELKAKTGEEVSRELRQRGGKILRVNNAVNDFRAIGKILYHFYEWYPFLLENEGVAVLAEVRPQGCKTFTPEDYHQHYHHRDAELFTEYLEKRKHRPYRPRKHRHRPPPLEQPPLN